MDPTTPLMRRASMKGLASEALKERDVLAMDTTSPKPGYFRKATTADLDAGRACAVACNTAEKDGDVYFYPVLIPPKGYVPPKKRPLITTAWLKTKKKRRKK